MKMNPSGLFDDLNTIMKRNYKGDASCLLINLNDLSLPRLFINGKQRFVVDINYHWHTNDPEEGSRVINVVYLDDEYEEVTIQFDNGVKHSARTMGENRMITAKTARTKSNEVIANIKNQAIKDLMPQINEAIEAAIGKGNKRIRVVIKSELNDTQKRLEEQSRIVFIRYESNEHVISAIVDELKRYGYVSAESMGMFGKQDSSDMAVDISWAEDNAKG